MSYLKEVISESKAERKKSRKAPKISPGGQSTQLVIGASPENDKEILELSDDLYKGKNLKRVYYSGYVPISDDSRLPTIDKTPVIRENRLYQADWLMRFYGFKVDEIVNEDHPELDLEMDPKSSFALRNLHLFPVDINKADYHQILRVPGIGVKSARKILSARKFTKLREEHLKKIGIIWKRAQYFITCQGQSNKLLSQPIEIISNEMKPVRLQTKNPNQLSLFGD